MSSIPYYQRAAPFWDWVTNLEEQGWSHPSNAGPRGSGLGPEGPWSFGQAFTQHGWPFESRGPFPHRGPPGRHEPPSGEENAQPTNEKEKLNEDEPMNTTTEEDEEEEGTPTPGREHFGGRGHHHGGRHHGGGRHDRHDRHGRGGFGGGEGCRGRGGRRGGHARGPPSFGGRGPWESFGNSGEFLQNQFHKYNGNGNEESGDFRPAADVFDTESAYVIHVSLAGAQKEDVAVNWDSEKSEVIITGVVHRPGSEDFLKTLALNERKIGAFERKIRLGSPAHPAAVDANGITAKLEDGVLRVQIPKEDKEFVNVMKVDVE